MINAHDYPDKHLANKSYTHNLETLHQVAGLEAAFKAEVTANAAFARNWIVVKDWNAESRYERHSHAKAQKIIDAITDTTNGLLPWIKARW